MFGDKSYNQSFQPIVANPVYPFMKRIQIDLSVAGHELEGGHPIEIREPFRFIGIRNMQGATLQLDNDVRTLIDSKQMVMTALERGGQCGGLRIWFEPSSGIGIIEYSQVAMSYYPADLALGGGVTQIASTSVVSVANTRLPLVAVRNGRTELIIQADPANTADVLIGGPDSTVDSALVLHPDGIFSTTNFSGAMDFASTVDNQRLRVMEVF
jgi:hypothetical protein